MWSVVLWPVAPPAGDPCTISSQIELNEVIRLQEVNRDHEVVMHGQLPTMHHTAPTHNASCFTCPQCFTLHLPTMHYTSPKSLSPDAHLFNASSSGVVIQFTRSTYLYINKNWRHHISPPCSEKLIKFSSLSPVYIYCQLHRLCCPNGNLKQMPSYRFS